ncbi:MAG TPA: CAP domain-containing protein [Candidatus Saccharibacteria bacterium]|nr:CAP domain-containing protein [Candidatus Saccharibacteria bacterium]
MKQTRRNLAFHFRRFTLFSILLLAFFIVRFDAAASPTTDPGRGTVLAYATEMSREGLLAGTNAARAANGLGALSLQSQLNNSAQAKAQHMADHDYWAHVAPDGTQPWYFFSQAGYVYIRAGENLAYGFGTSQGAIDGWMNSPSHRANILGNYADVGFGIVNMPNYQGNGQQTIVVAHYGTKSTPPPAPTPAAPTAPAAPAAPQTPAPAAETPAETTAPPEEVAEPEVATPVKEEEPETKPQDEIETTASPVSTAEPTTISVLSMLSARNLPFAALTSLLLVGFAAVGYVLTHRSAFHHAVHAGEHFVVAHPGVDTAVIAAVTALIVLTTYGNIG